MSEKILLDTNIIIHREILNPATNPNIGALFYWIEKCKYEKWIHPISISEIEKYEDKKILTIIKNKIKNYYELKTISNDDENIKKIRELDKNINDKNDTDILREVYNNRVDYLITEDKKISYKAKLLGIDHKVYEIDSFLDKLISENPEFNDYDVLSVKKAYIGRLNINDPFFNSLREDYQGFNERFNKKSEDTAYVYFGNGKNHEIHGFLYLKVEDENEDYSDINPILPRKNKRLKIGTFKVDHPGYKLGERFLKIIFDNAIIKKVDEIYLTIHNNGEEKTRLVNLITDRGFYKWGVKGDEDVYVRDFDKAINKENPLMTYPYLDKSVNIFICPIRPQYHTDLFPDSILSTESKLDFIEPQPYRNSIRKAFLSRSVERGLSTGDIILFYRTGGLYKSVITTIGVVEKVFDGISSLEEFINLSRKRSLFSDDEIKEFRGFSSSISPFIVYFSHIVSLEKKITLKKLIELGIVKNVYKAPRGFTKITKEQFDLIIKEAKINESYFVN